MDVPIYILDALVYAFVPIVLLLMHKDVRFVILKKVLLCAGILGVIFCASVCALYSLKGGQLSGDIALWADDFFFGSLGYIAAVSLSAVVLLTVSVLAGKLKILRYILYFLYPLSMCLFCMLLSIPAQSKVFDVSVYIAALSPGAMMLIYFPLCAEVYKKSKQHT